MAEDSAPIAVDPRLVTRIVGSYVKHNNVGGEELAGLIAEVHRTLGGLGRVAPTEEARAPAVPIRRSVRPDYVVCLDCGFQGKMLRRHIRRVHGLEPAAYRARWNLSADHPLTAPSYTAQRSNMAKLIGLGRARRKPAPQATPARRGRKRQKAPST